MYTKYQNKKYLWNNIFLFHSASVCEMIKKNMGVSCSTTVTPVIIIKDLLQWYLRLLTAAKGGCDMAIMILP